MQALFRYPGSKAKQLDQIMSRIPLSVDSFVEPFAGTAVTSLALAKRQKLHSLVINDADIGIASIWWSVINELDEFCSRIETYTPSVDDFYLWKKYPLNEISVETGFQKLVLHQISYSGLGTKAGSPIGGRLQKGSYKIGCRWNANSLIKKATEFHNVLGSVTNVSVCNTTDYFSLGLGFTYLDPPYFSAGPSLYKYGQFDHVKLSHYLHGATFDWILSYDDVDDIRDMYSWAEIYPVVVRSNLHHNKTQDLLITRKENLGV